MKIIPCLYLNKINNIFWSRGSFDSKSFILSSSSPVILKSYRLRMNCIPVFNSVLFLLSQPFPLPCIVQQEEIFSCIEWNWDWIERGKAMRWVVRYSYRQRCAMICNEEAQGVWVSELTRKTGRWKCNNVDVWLILMPLKIGLIHNNIK